MPPTVQVAGDLLGLGLQLPAELFEAGSNNSSKEGLSMSAIASFTVLVTAVAVSNAYYRFYLTPLFKRAEVACYTAVETAGKAFMLGCVDDPCTVQEGIQTLELRFIKLYQELSLQAGANSNRYFKYSFWTKYLDLSQKVRRYRECGVLNKKLHRTGTPMQWLKTAHSRISVLCQLARSYSGSTSPACAQNPPQRVKNLFYSYVVWVVDENGTKYSLNRRPSLGTFADTE
ncbi:hypothetical protein DL96DRAFT_1552689 [Flagelloscypha sp. PMI_526]|nr:hypothetical protein DL96DRAFT_1552689 [Flagelloscypha sp. PMI_526]